MSFHVLPPEIEIVRFSCFQGCCGYMRNADFMQVSEKIPLLGMLAMGHSKFKPTVLQVDERGIATVRVLEELQITLNMFLFFLQTLRDTETAHVQPLYRNEVRFVSEKLCCTDLIANLVKRWDEEERAKVLCIEQDLHNLYDWKTLGPSSPFMPFDFSHYEREGWSLTKIKSLRKNAVLYIMRRPKAAK